MPKIIKIELQIIEIANVIFIFILWAVIVNNKRKKILYEKINKKFKKRYIIEIKRRTMYKYSKELEEV